MFGIDFVTKHNEMVEKISKENKVCYLMDDLNLNQLNHELDNATGEFMDGLYFCTFFH